MGDNLSLEQFFNDLASVLDGTSRNLRVTNVANQFEGYQVVDTDSNPGAVSYYGYLDADGAWIIMKQTDSGTVSAYTFATGSSGYDFSNRASETYQAFDVAF